MRRPVWFRVILATVVALVIAAPVGVTAQTSTSQTSPALPQGDDLTLADGAGNVLIGLTLRPAQAGPSTLLIHVLPLEGPAAAADVQVSLSITGRDVPLDFCSRSCRTADATLAGGEHVDIAADSPTGGTASFDLPTLHGAAAICLSDNALVLVSSDGENGDLPGGRPEPNESLIDTLRREMREEACAVLTSYNLLGFSRGLCVRGHEQGLVLVRSLWRADVLL